MIIKLVNKIIIILIIIILIILNWYFIPSVVNFFVYLFLIPFFLILVYKIINDPFNIKQEKQKKIMIESVRILQLQKEEKKRISIESAHILKLQQEKKAQSLAELRALSAAKFEQWIASKFIDSGYQAYVIGGAGDDGIDIEVHSGGTIRFVVQAKRYGSRTFVTPEAVRGFRGAMTKYPDATGFLVTTGMLTSQAMDWVRNQPITVVDAQSIDQWNPPSPELAG